jgi:thiamine-monophosphate kinase
MPRRAVDGLEDGDAVVVTGILGAAAAGCLVTYRLKGSGDQLRERKRYIEALGHVLEVRPRLAEGRALAGTGLVRCAMDLSDGLARSLHTLGGLNDCGFALTAGDLPAAKYAGATATGEGVSIEELTLYYGGDFELVAVLGGGADGVAAAAKAVEAAGGTLTVVGRVVAGGEFALEGPEGAAELEDRGWEHFFSS